MSQQESAESQLNSLLAWERPFTRQSDRFGSECIVPGPLDGFVDLAATYVNVLHAVGEARDVLDRAREFDSLTAPGSALDAARIAIQPIVEAFANANEGWNGGREWGMSRPSGMTDAGFIRRHRRTPDIVPQDVVSVIAQLGTSLDCFRWNPGESHRCVSKLLTFSLDPPLPNREGLEYLETSMSEVLLNAGQNTAWGCWLLIQCHETTKQPPPKFARLVQKLDGIHIDAIKAAARFTANLDKDATRGTPALDTKEIQHLRLIRDEIDPKRMYIGESVPLYRMFERINLLNSQSDEPVLILGPTGAGKTKLAELIHRYSPRRDGKFVTEQARQTHTKSFLIQGLGQDIPYSILPCDASWQCLLCRCIA